MLYQKLLNLIVNFLRLFGSQMADGTVYQLQAGLDSTFTHIFNALFVADALYPGVCAKFQIDFVRVINHFLGKIFSDEPGQIAAYLIA